MLTLQTAPDHSDQPLQLAEPQTANPAMVDAGYSIEAIAMLGISELHGVGFQTLTRLGGRSGIRALLGAKTVAAFKQSIAEAGGKFSAGSLPEDWDTLRRQLWQSGLESARTLVETGVQFCFQGEPTFPKAAADLKPKSQPHWLFYRGDIQLLDHPCVTVVGTRNPTPNGAFLAKYAVSCARELNAPVISGLAYGIDRIVHEWCLNVGAPTISILGTGMLTTYPAKHAGLADQIVAAGGLLVSEYMPQQGPSAENFVWRNRLQAALGRAVIPAEWAKKSGTAHTVRFARQLKRPVFSMSLGGVSRAPEAGDGDQHFEIPRDNAMFSEALASTLTLSVPIPMKQMGLFGNTD